MRHRVAPTLFLLATAACYEHAPHRGQLAAATDSLIAAHGMFECRSVPKPAADLPDAHVCGVGADSNNIVGVFYVGRHGRILELTRMWRGDSVGEQRLAALRLTLTRSFGPPFVNGFREGRHVMQWRSDSVCASVGRRSVANEAARIDYGLALREPFGGCLVV